MFTITSFISAGLAPIGGYYLYKFLKNNLYGYQKFQRVVIFQVLVTFLSYKSRLRFMENVEAIEKKYLNDLHESYIINFE